MRRTLLNTLIHYTLLFLVFFPLHAQDIKTVPAALLGHWTGAFIRDNAYQGFEIKFYQQDGQLLSLQIMEEWHPTYGEFVIPFSISNGQIVFNTGIGKATATLDAKNLELIGQIDSDDESTFLHLKKVPDPPLENVELLPLNIPSGEVLLSGHLHLPRINTKKTAIILVGGRGCNADNTAYNLYAQFLRKYGIAVLAYQKRGTGNSTGDCSKASIDDLSSDLSALYEYLDQATYQFDNIGVLGISAGGWTMAKAAENMTFSFMISIVGPSTSVYDQQMQSMEYGASFYDLNPGAKQSLMEYTRLMFEAEANKRSFDKMSALLERSEAENWRQLLEATDIPQSPGDIENLWVRRHSFDPQEVLRSFKNPLLAIYGENDWIVPAQENLTALNHLFFDKQDLLSTVLAHDAEHGMEKEAKYIDLNKPAAYWRFYRIAPEVRIEIVRFLRQHDLIE